MIATGARNWYFGHDGWAEVAPGLKRIEDATRIRRNILSAFEDAELARDDAERMRLLTFVIIGGGPTGVEMAGAMPKSRDRHWLGTSDGSIRGPPSMSGQAAQQR